MKRYSHFIRLFFSYLLNLVIIISGTFVCLQFFLMNSVYDEIKKQDGEILLQTQRHMDSSIAAMDRIADAISVNSRFTPFNLPDNPYKAILAIDSLKTYALYSANISLIGISYTNSNYALSHRSSLTKEYFSSFSLPPFRELIKTENLTRKYITTEDSVIFVYPYPNLSNVLGVIFIQYPIDAFYEEFISSFPDNQRYLSVKTDSDSDALFTNINAPIERADYTSYISSATGYRYEIATPFSYYDSIFNKFKLRLMMVIAGFFCLGFALNIIIARYNVLPLRKLIEKIGLPDSKADFQAIENFLSEQQIVWKQTARDQVLLKLMEGGFASMADLNNEGNKVGMDFSGGCFAFIIVHEPSAEARQSRGSPPDQISTSDGKALFYRQFDRSAENDIWVYSGRMPAFSETFLRDFRAGAYGTRQVTVAAGSVSDNTVMAAQYFLEALTAMNYRLVRGRGSIILFGSLPEADKIDNKKLDDLLLRFGQSIEETEWDDTAAALEAIIDFCRNYSLSASRYIIWRVLYQIHELRMLHSVPVQQLAEIETMENLMEFIRELMNNTIASVRGKACNFDTDLAERIKIHVDHNFSDKMLSLKTISEALGFSAGHLSRVFKQQTGNTLVSHIHELRIREACRLLRFTNMPIKDIVMNIGCMDHSSFSRSFKGRMGVSPQEYRNSTHETGVKNEQAT